MAAEHLPPADAAAVARALSGVTSTFRPAVYWLAELARLLHGDHAAVVALVLEAVQSAELAAEDGSRGEHAPRLELTAAELAVVRAVLAEVANGR